MSDIFQFCGDIFASSRPNHLLWCNRDCLMLKVLTKSLAQEGTTLFTSIATQEKDSPGVSTSTISITMLQRLLRLAIVGPSGIRPSTSVVSLHFNTANQCRALVFFLIESIGLLQEMSFEIDLL